MDSNDTHDRASTRTRRALRWTREWLTLSEGARARQALGAQASSVDHAVRRARERAESAYLLWSHGARAEALALLHQAADALRELATSHPALRARIGDPSALGGHERYGEREETLPSDIAARFASLSKTVDVALARVESVTYSRAARSKALLVRYGSLLAAVIGGAAVIRDARFKHRVHARASGYFSGTYAPANAVDRRVNTQWLLPNGELGWIRLTFPSRRVRILRMLNVQGMPSYGTTEARVELLVGERVVQTIPVTMRAMLANPQPLRLPIHYSSEIDGIRVHVTEFVGFGGGFAELEVE